MPQVPVAQRQVEVGAAPQIRQSADVPIEAFGGGASAAGVAAAGQRLGAVGQDIFKEEKQKADQSALTGLDLEATKAQTQIEVAIKNMRGKDALGAAQYANDEWTKVTERLKDSAANPAQLSGINNLLQARAGQIDRTAQMHATSEIQAFDQQQSESYIAAQADHAVLHHENPELVHQDLDNQKAEIERLGKRMGWDQGTIDLKSHDSGSLTLSAIVSRKLDNGDYSGAQQFYDANKDGFAAHDVGRVEKSLEDGKVLNLGKDAYAKFGGLKLSDGNPDLAAIESRVNSDPNLKDKEREQVLTFVKAKVGEYRVNKAAQDRARDESFRNNAVTARKNGTTLEQALTIPRKFSDGSYDQALKEDFVRKLYAPADVKTDPATKVALLDGIDEGTVTRDQIDRAYQQQLISPNDWVSARERYHNVVTEGKSPVQQRANEQLRILAKGRFGSDTDGMNSFISEVKSDSMGKSPEEMIKIGNDKLKQDEGSVSRFWNWIPVVGGGAIPMTGQPQYEIDIEKRSAQSLVKGKLQQDLGVETVKAIELGNSRTGSPATAAETIDAMSAAFGGYDKMKAGTPVYNAMQSLSRAGKVVTVDSIKKVLEYHPDGLFTSAVSPGDVRIGKISKGKI